VALAADRRGTAGVGWPAQRRLAVPPGLLSAATNPKGILFFAAFLPQFIDPASSLWLQFAIMAGTFAGIDVVTEFVIASTAHRIRPWLQRVGKRFNQACGGVLVAIGAALPLRA
jgi:threonine/homoserine/homoserine lactone efflux protein